MPTPRFIIAFLALVILASGCKEVQRYDQHGQSISADEAARAGGYYDEDGSFVPVDEEGVPLWYDKAGDPIGQDEVEALGGYYDTDGYFVELDEDADPAGLIDDPDALPDDTSARPSDAVGTDPAFDGLDYVVFVDGFDDPVGLATLEGHLVVYFDPSLSTDVDTGERGLRFTAELDDGTVVTTECLQQFGSDFAASDSSCLSAIEADGGLLVCGPTATSPIVETDALVGISTPLPVVGLSSLEGILLSPEIEVPAECAETATSPQGSLTGASVFIDDLGTGEDIEGQLPYVTEPR